METYNEAWVAERVEQTIDLWNTCASGPRHGARQYDSSEQQQHERVYDEALRTVEGELESRPQSEPEQLGLRSRLITSFGLFAARALDLDDAAIELLTHEFLPVGTELAQRARRFDPTLGMGDIIQAARNAWTACGLQPLFGSRIMLTPSILGYSLIYPYSDNYLDDESIEAETKYQFSRRFRARLMGEPVPAENHQEHAIWKLIALIETQYPRALFPRVFECLLAIHQAQEQSVRQLHKEQQPDHLTDVLRLSCAKGGTSVLTDACLVNGSLSEAESQFAFEWGVLLQLGDDLQDLRDDMRCGRTTMFSRAAAAGKPLDQAALQLLAFSEKVSQRMDALPHGTETLKELLKMSWRSLIVRAVAESHEFFSPTFLAEAERFSSFHFDFLRNRSECLASRHGLYATIFGQLASCDSETLEWPISDGSDWLPDPDPAPSVLQDGRY